MVCSVKPPAPSTATERLRVYQTHVAVALKATRARVLRDKVARAKSSLDSRTKERTKMFGLEIYHGEGIGASYLRGKP